MLDQSTVARFWGRVRKTDDCWLWTGGKTIPGYGLFPLHRLASGKYARPYAHRISWELAFGPIPAGLHVCHHCDVPSCVRPSHLFTGTDADNAWDKSRKGRSPTGDKHGMRLHPEQVPRGERSGAAKLTEADVRRIRSRYAAGGITQQAIADEYGVTNGCICMVINRRHWAHVD